MTDAGERPGPAGDAESELRHLRHDLRTPLAVVVGFAELLASDREIDAGTRREYAQRIVDAGRELRVMLDALEPPAG